MKRRQTKKTKKNFVPSSEMGAASNNLQDDPPEIYDAPTNIKLEVEDTKPSASETGDSKTTIGNGKTSKDKTVCTDCGKRFKTFELKVRHRDKVHTICSHPNCGKKFETVYNCRAHFRKVHLAIRNYQCHMCAKLLKTGSALKNHIYSLHLKPEEKLKFQCEVCAKVFFHHSKLEQHKTLHTGEKPFTCSVKGCKNAFRLKSSLRKHVQSDHNRVGLLQCEICGETFKRKPYLRAHMFKHTGIKEFQCKVCQKRFTSEFNLSTHSKMHSDNRVMWNCDICTRSFTFKSNLTKHIKTVHGETETNLKSKKIKYEIV